MTVAARRRSGAKAWDRIRNCGVPLAKQARIVLLNGVGSVGKTAIAKAMQAITAEPFLHVEMDAFLNMMPERY